MSHYIQIAVLILAVIAIWFSYNSGRQDVLHKLSNDRVEVMKDGQKIDAAVYAADDNRLVCLLIDCKTN